jgi:hypothetical protein
MLTSRLLLALMFAALILTACGNDDDRLRQDVEAKVAAGMEDRDDISPAEKQAAAAALAEDVVELKREMAEAQDDIAAHQDRLESELPTQADLQAQDCEQRRLELGALQRLAQDPGSLSADEQQALPVEIRQAEAALAEKCD